MEVIHEIMTFWGLVAMDKEGTKSAGSAMVYEHIVALAKPQFSRADSLRAGIFDAEELNAYIADIRSRFRTLLRLPNVEREPLSARTTGVVIRDGYRIEKVIFESRPSFLVTANLYLPTDVCGPLPGVLHPLGHTWNAKAGETYQRVAVTLVKNGFAVFSYDPIGQGERIQYWDPLRECSSIVARASNSAVAEHEYAGIQSLLTGVSMGGLMVWDGMRALDYLLSRPEIDPERIGCTGVSGGGTNTSYLMALDERIRVAAPICYITKRQRWLARNEYADAEQVQDDVIKEGIDHTELCIATAPRPLLIGTSTEDFFPMEGALESAEQARQAYALLGVSDRVQTVVAEGQHGFLPVHRVAVSDWFRQWLCNEENPQSVDWGADLTLEEDETLWATPQGQTFHLGSRTVFSFTRQEALRLEKSRKRWFAQPAGTDISMAQKELRSRLQELLRVDVPQEPVRVEVAEASSDVKGATLTHLRYWPESGIEIPAVLMRPLGVSTQSVVYVSEHECSTVAESLAELHSLTAAGATVLVIEMRGKGSTLSAACKMSNSYKRLGVEGYHLYNYGMVGRNLLGCRVLDVLAGVNCMRQLTGMNAATVIGEDLGALAALMAGALDTQIAGVQLRGLLVSYKALATNEFRHQPASVFVPGILQVCDLPEIAACVAPRPLNMVSVVDEKCRPLFGEQIASEYGLTRNVYAQLGVDSSLMLPS
ncbi:MAG: alpha/beta hydrolase family protein [Limnochordia bacterium]